MKFFVGKGEFGSDFRQLTNLSVGIAAGLLILPFSINNFIQGRYLLGVGSTAVCFILLFNAWLVLKGRFLPLFVVAVIMPTVIFLLNLAFLLQGIIGALWCYPAVIAFYFILPERQAWLANGIILITAFVHSWLVLEPSIGMRVAATLVVVSIFAAIFIRIITIQQSKLMQLAETDKLTGLYNRTLFEAVLQQAVMHYQRSGVPATLVSFDLDYFKKINDEYGHHVGDQVLRSIGDILRKRLRRSDRAFRMGGEEFLLLLYGTDMENGKKLAEELRTYIEGSAIIPQQTITASFGVATLQENEGWQAWVKRCDANLYSAKDAGRNRVIS